MQSAQTFKVILFATFISLVVMLNFGLANKIAVSSGFLFMLLFYLISIAIFVIVISSTYGVGFWIGHLINLFGDRDNNLVLRHATYFYLGLIIYSIFIHVLGFFQFLRPFGVLTLIPFGLSAFFYTEFKPLKISSLLKNWKTNDLLTKCTWFIIVIFFISRLFPVLYFNSFGDPLYYNLPIGRDYLKIGGFKWLEYEPYYANGGLGDIFLTVFHSITANTQMVQISSQLLYFSLGPVLLFILLYIEFFPRFISKKHSLWISFSFVCTSSLRLESIVAKPDYLLLTLFISILIFICRIYESRNIQQTVNDWGVVLFLFGMMISLKITSVSILAPLAVAILIFMARFIPFTNKRLVFFLVFALTLASLNLIRNQYIYSNPVFPLANEIFNSPYWDNNIDSYSMMYPVKKNQIIEYLVRLPEFLRFNPTSIIFILVSIFLFFQRHVGKGILNNKGNRFLMILAFTWLFGFVFWVQFFSAQVFPRFIICFVFLTFLLPPLFAMQVLKRSGIQKFDKALNKIGFLSLLLSITASNTNIDWSYPYRLFSEESIQLVWKNSSPAAELEHYLNIDGQNRRVLYFYSNHRFHSNSIVYSGAGMYPLTRFVYSKDPQSIRRGLEQLKIGYFAIEKNFANDKSVLMTQIDFLNKNFCSVKETKGYYLFDVECQ